MLVFIDRLWSLCPIYIIMGLLLNKKPAHLYSADPQVKPAIGKACGRTRSAPPAKSARR